MYLSCPQVHLINGRKRVTVSCRLSQQLIELAGPPSAALQASIALSLSRRSGTSQPKAGETPIEQVYQIPHRLLHSELSQEKLFANLSPSPTTAVPGPGPTAPRFQDAGTCSAQSAPVGPPKLARCGNRVASGGQRARERLLGPAAFQVRRGGKLAQILACVVLDAWTASGELLVQLFSSSPGFYGRCARHTQSTSCLPGT